MSLVTWLTGISVPTWVMELAVGLALLGGGILYFEHRGAREELGKLQVSSAALVAKAEKTIRAETEKHAADNAANLEKLDAANRDNAALGSALDQRVRDFDAYRRAHPDVPRPAGGPAAPVGGECGAQSCSDLAVQLAERGNDLARSVADLTAALQAAERDRDSLTGLPR